MSCICNGQLHLAPGVEHSQGATEQQARRFVQLLPASAYQHVQIHVSKQTMPIDPTKLQILWQHDTWDDAYQCVDRYPWDAVVFVSRWQRDQYLAHHDIHCRTAVIENVIDPVPTTTKPTDTLEFVYAAAPDRGLDVLCAVFDRLYRSVTDRLRLTIFTGFDLYGWPEQDAPWRPYWQIISQHPGIRFRGFEPDHAQILAAKQQAHVWLYPTSWQENSCVSLIESLACGMLCVHPDRGALAETAAGRSIVYEWSADREVHAERAYAVMHDIVRAWCDHGQWPRMLGPPQLPCHDPRTFSRRWQQVLQDPQTMWHA